MKKTYTFLALITSLLLLVGCASLFETAPPPERYNPVFDFSPPERSEARSAGITIALINPVYADVKERSQFYRPPYSTFISNMANDFEEMITAKGLSIRGPFATRDEMVYGDKKYSNLALQVEVDLKEEGSLNSRRYGGHSAYTPIYYKIYGTFYQYGNLNLTVIDPMTGEKFWKKSVSLPRKEIVCNGIKKFARIPSGTELLTDVGIYNPIAQAMESYYGDALESAWRHISVEEFQQIAKEIEKARKD